MSLPAWPSTLPPPVGQVGSLGSDELYAPPQETEFDDGPVRTRRKRLYVETPLKVTLKLTHAQFVAFRDFVVGTLNTGARRFTAEVRLPSGRLGVRTCRIVGKLAFGDEGAWRQVTFTLGVRDW